jgi:hypothetical protein
MPIDRVLDAEKRVECKDETQVNSATAALGNICAATDKQLFQLVEWAKHIPHFTELPFDDQVVLLRAGNNIHINTLSYQHSITTLQRKIKGKGYALVVHLNPINFLTFAAVYVISHQLYPHHRAAISKK